MNLEKVILAVITLDRDKVGLGGAPVFFAADKEEQEHIATYMARITEGVIHDLENGVLILVKH